MIQNTFLSPESDPLRTNLAMEKYWLEFSSDNYCLMNTNDQSLANAGKIMGDMFLVRHCCENLYFSLMMCFPRLFPHMLLICCAFLMSLLSWVFPIVNHLPLSLPFMFYNVIIMRRNYDCVWEACQTAWKFQGSKQIGLISVCLLFLLGEGAEARWGVFKCDALLWKRGRMA